MPNITPLKAEKRGSEKNVIDKDGEKGCHMLPSKNNLVMAIVFS